MKTVRSLLAAIIASSVMFDCYYDNEETLYGSSVNCASVTYTYKDAGPVLINTCATTGCHDSSNAGNVTLLTSTQAKENASRINQRTVIEKTMPPGRALTATQLEVLRCWIANGTPL